MKGVDLDFCWCIGKLVSQKKKKKHFKSTFFYLCTLFKEPMAKAAHPIFENLKTGSDKLLLPMLYSMYFIKGLQIL